MLSFLFYVDLPRNLSNALRLMLFYGIGYYSKEFKLFDKIAGLKYWFILLPSCIALIACTFYSPSWQGKNMLLVIVSASAGIYMIVFVSRQLDVHTKGKIRQVVLYIGKHTLTILALHLFCNCFVKAAYVAIYHLDVDSIATTERIPDYRWTAVYVIVGLVGSLLIGKVGYLLKNRLTKLIH